MPNHDEKIVDLRSDTIKMPTREMLESILEAPLGDDVYGEDPTVNRLEELAAKKTGKEAALLTASGTQANLISTLSNTRRGDEVILEAEAHMYYYEVGGMSAIAGVIPRLVKGKMGVLDPLEVEKEIRHPSISFPPTSLICIENTHNRAGGTITSPKQIEAMWEIAQKHNLRLYMDGSRIFNAAVALGLDVKHFTKNVDNLMFCLSKGLGAPVGSIIVGDKEFIEKARKHRKILGGGMRQAGIIAAPGIIALEKMVDRLAEDHSNAKMLADGLSRINGIQINLETVQTNIVVFDVSALKMTGQQFIIQLSKKHVKASDFGNQLVRMVTHIGITENDIKYTLEAIEDVSKNSNNS